MTALLERPAPDVVASPAVMPAQQSIRIEIRRPRACPSCARRHTAGVAREHSIVRYLTATGHPAGETTVWSDVDAWIDRQTQRGWTVDYHDPATGAAVLTRPTGAQQLIEPRTR